MTSLAVWVPLEGRIRIVDIRLYEQFNAWGDWAAARLDKMERTRRGWLQHPTTEGLNSI